MAWRGGYSMILFVLLFSSCFCLFACLVVIHNSRSVGVVCGEGVFSSRISLGRLNRLFPVVALRATPLAPTAGSTPSAPADGPRGAARWPGCDSSGETGLNLSRRSPEPPVLVHRFPLNTQSKSKPSATTKLVVCRSRPPPLVRFYQRRLTLAFKSNQIKPNQTKPNQIKSRSEALSKASCMRCRCLLFSFGHGVDVGRSSAEGACQPRPVLGEAPLNILRFPMDTRIRA